MSMTAATTSARRKVSMVVRVPRRSWYKSRQTADNQIAVVQFGMSVGDESESLYERSLKCALSCKG